MSLATLEATLWPKAGGKTMESETGQDDDAAGFCQQYG